MNLLVNTHDQCALSYLLTFFIGKTDWLIDWLIDWLNAKWATFQLYSRQEQVYMYNCKDQLLSSIFPISIPSGEYFELEMYLNVWRRAVETKWIKENISTNLKKNRPFLLSTLSRYTITFPVPPKWQFV